jgi:hypothetical protein
MRDPNLASGAEEENTEASEETLTQKKGLDLRKSLKGTL